MGNIGRIERERLSWGDPVDVILNDATAIGGKPLHRVVYDNGKWEWARDRDLNQCSAGVGGDAASGCDTIINPYSTDGLCVKHRGEARVERAIASLLGES